MPTPVEVSLIKRSAENQSGVEGLGGIWRDRPWYMPERSVIAEVQLPADQRQWYFFVIIDGKTVPLTIASVNGRKYIMAGSKPMTILGLAEWRDHDERGWPIGSTEDVLRG